MWLGDIIMVTRGDKGNYRKKLSRALEKFKMLDTERAKEIPTFFLRNNLAGTQKKQVGNETAKKKRINSSYI